MMKCCQFKQLHPMWYGRLVSVKMEKKEENKREKERKVKENNDSSKTRSMADQLT